MTGEAAWVARLDLESTRPLSSGLDGESLVLEIWLLLSWLP